MAQADGGIGVCDANWVRDNIRPAPDSAYAEGVPRPGSATTDNERDLLVPTVSQAQTRDVDIQVTRGGFADNTGAARVTYSVTNPDHTYGWSAPQQIAAFEPVDWVTSGTLTEYFQAATHPITGQPWVTYGLAAGGAKVARRDVSGAWVTVTTITAATELAAAMAFTPDGSALVVHTGSGTVQSPRATLITPDGTVQTIVDVSAGMTATADRMRLVHIRDSTFLLLVLTTPTTVTQYVTEDYGATYQEVAPGAVLGADLDLVPLANGGIGVGYLDTSNDPQFLRIQGEYDSVHDATPVGIGPTGTNNLTTSRDPGTGWLWAFPVNGADLTPWYSTDEGATWVQVIRGLLDTSTSSTRPRQMSATPVWGGFAILHTHAASVGTGEQSLGCLYAGGWSTRRAFEHPLITNYPGYGARSLLDGHTWLPYDRLQDTTGWAATGAGTETLGAAYSEITTSSQLRYYTRTLTTVTTFVSLDFTVQQVAGGTTTTADIAATMQISDGVDDHRLVARVSAGALVVADVHGGTDLFTVNTSFASAPKQVRIDVTSHDTVRLWWREYDARAVWVLGGTGTLTGAAGTTSLVTVGHRASGTATSRWYHAWVSTGDTVPGVDEYAGGPVTALPGPVPDIGSDAQAAYLSAGGGVAITGTTHTIAAEHDYPIEHAIPLAHPSPAVRAILGSATGSAGVAWDTNTQELRDVLGLAVINTTAQIALIQWWDGANWVGLPHLLDLAVIQGADWQRTDNALRPPLLGVATNRGRYFWQDELRGAWCLFGGVYRQITGNTAGVWDHPGTGDAPQVRIFVELTGGEPTSGSGDLTVWHHSGVVLIDSSTAQGDRLRLVATRGSIPTPLSAGLIVPFRYVPWGKHVSWGWSSEHVLNTTTNENQAGTLRVRNRAPDTGWQRRDWTIDWRDVHNLRNLRQQDLSAITQYRADTSDQGTAQGDVAQILAAMGRRPDLVRVALRTSPALGTTITDPTLYNVGHVTTNARAENVGGTPGTDEQQRVPSITLRGVV